MRVAPGRRRGRLAGRHAQPAPLAHCEVMNACVLAHHPSPAGTLVWLGLAMVAATAAIAIARYFEGAFGHNAAFKILHDVRMRCYEQMQRLSMGFHTKQQSGAMAAKIIGDVETIEFFTAHAGIQLISASLVPVFIGILMLAVNWRLGLVALAPLLLILAILTLFREAANAAFKRSRDELGRLGRQRGDDRIQPGLGVGLGGLSGQNLLVKLRVVELGQHVSSSDARADVDVELVQTGDNARHNQHLALVLHCRAEVEDPVQIASDDLTDTDRATAGGLGWLSIRCGRRAADRQA